VVHILRYIKTAPGKGLLYVDKGDPKIGESIISWRLVWHTFSILVVVGVGAKYNQYTVMQNVYILYSSL